MARPANTSILDSTRDLIPNPDARTTMTFRVVPQTTFFKVAFSPADPVAINQDTTLTTMGEAGYFQSIGISNRVPYTVTASVQELADVDGGVTQNRLRAAGLEYPAGIVARYPSVPANAMGPEAKKLLADIQARVKASDRTTPYDVASMVVNELHKPIYRYDTNVTGVCDRAQSIVECFAANKVGFCEHFATTMVILSGPRGSPPGSSKGSFRESSMSRPVARPSRPRAPHAWVEVYFPGIGWHTFDPTGGLDSTGSSRSARPGRSPPRGRCRR